MISLGIETTAHTFGIGIINEKGKVLANVKDSFTTKKSDLIPAKLSKHHVEVCDVVLKGALEIALRLKKEI